MTRLTVPRKQLRALVICSLSDALSNVASSGRRQTSTLFPARIGDTDSTICPPTSTCATPSSWLMTMPPATVSMPTKAATSASTGEAKTSSGVPTWRSWPATSTPTRSPSARASSRSWVIISVVVPVSRRTSFMSLMREARVGGSSAAKGSSRRSVSGASTSARARLVRCASPPERVLACRFARCSMPKRSSQNRTDSFASASFRPRSLRPRATFSCTVVSSSSGSWKTTAIRRRVGSRSLPQRIGSPPTRISPLVGRLSRARQRRSVLLPAPFGPMIAITSPALTARDGTSSTTRSPKRTVTFVASSAGR